MSKSTFSFVTITPGQSSVMFAERREMRSLQKAGLLPKSLFSGHSDRPLSTGPTSLTFPDITGVCREQETISKSPVSVSPVVD